MKETPQIIQEVKGYTIVYKPAGIPVQPDRSKDKSLMDLITEQTQRPYHLCNRIDRPVSGCIILAHNPAAHAKFAKSKTIKHYIAIVEKADLPTTGSISGFLTKDSLKRRSTYSAERQPNSKAARIDYKIIAPTDRYLILDIELLTGKYHQIRSLLSQVAKCPIKGDVKYGARRANRDRSIHLHCYAIENETLGLQVSQPKISDDSLWKLAMEELSL